MTASRVEVERVLAENEFQYQRIELPYGLTTAGKDRRPVADIVLPGDLAGRSVLDIGCAIGFFSFEAERRNARKVVGTELDRKRLRQATVLKSIFDSRVELELRDVLEQPPSEPFDLVLALNVIHHLSDPFAALERLAAMTAWRLALEFPTFDSPKYRRRHAFPPGWRWEDQPLVGVMNARSRKAKKFVFSPAAIEHSIMSHHEEPLFASIRFIPSPEAGRMIAICEKG
jgi:SAM-dependent methyltransferase